MKIDQHEEDLYDDNQLQLKKEVTLSSFNYLPNDHYLHS